MSQSGKLMVWPSMCSVSLSSFCQRHANFLNKIPAMFHIVCVEFESNGEKCPSIVLLQCSHTGQYPRSVKNPQNT